MTFRTDPELGLVADILDDAGRIHVVTMTAMKAGLAVVEAAFCPTDSTPPDTHTMAEAYIAMALAQPRELSPPTPASLDSHGVAPA